MYQVIWTYDGCPDSEASKPFSTMLECKAFIKHMMHKHHTRFAADHKLGLDILNLESGRLISYVL